MSYEPNKTNEIEQSSKPVDTSCCLKRFFTTKNVCSKIAIYTGIVLLSVFAYNKIDSWLAYRNIEKIANEFFVTTDPFGWMAVSGMVEKNIDDINNKMLLCYLAKQQNEIIRNQKILVSKLEVHMKEGFKTEAFVSNTPSTHDTVTNALSSNKPQADVSDKGIQRQAAPAQPIKAQVEPKTTQEATTKTK